MAEDYHEHLDFVAQNGCSTGLSGHMHFEGVSFCNEERIERNPFGKYKLYDELQWVYGPCIARCQFSNGLLIFDTEKFELESVPLLWLRFRISPNSPKVSKVRKTLHLMFQIK